MGQKVNPISFRLGVIKNWPSKWFSDNKRKYRNFFLSDVKIRKFLEKKLKNSALALVEIERQADKAKIILHSSRPGMIIGRAGIGIESLKKELQKIIPKIKFEIILREVKEPESNAAILTQTIVEQIEKRIGYRRAAKKAIERASESAGVLGVKIMISGRLDGVEIARQEWFARGKLPLHTLRADVDFAKAQAYTTYGTVGIKTWIYKGEVFK
ncbi:MAG: 30S ribosomal protein S3 [Patescibacteria group bacterium]